MGHRDSIDYRTFLATAFGLAAGMSVCGAARADIRPEWATHSASRLELNQSFLAQLKEQQDPEAAKMVLDTTHSNELRQQYEDTVRDYEFRQKYGLVGTEGERAHEDQVRGFGQGLLDQIKSYQIKKNADKVEGIVKRDENLTKAVRPVAVAGAVVAACTGSPMDIRLSEGSKLTTRTNVPDQRGQFSLMSPVVNGSFEMSNKAPAAWDPTSADPTIHEEHYRVSLSRGLPLLNLSSAVSYGSTSNTVVTSVSKPLANNLTAVVDSTYSLYPDGTGPVQSQETLRLLYGIRF